MEANREVSKRKLAFPAWLALFLLAPFFGEVVSGATTPVELLNVFGVLMIACLYGGGALLIREAKVRLNKGWSFVFVWGCAYGILEEALCCKSFFDPHWPDIGRLGIYGRYIGVNWVWVFFLILFHASVSIMLPIYVSERIYPDKAGVKWMNRHGLIAAFVFMMLTVIVGFYFFPDGKNIYFPPLELTVASIIAIAALAAIGIQVPNIKAQQTSRFKPRALSALGFISYTLFAVCLFGFPNSVFAPWQAIGISVALFAALFSHVRRFWAATETQTNSSPFLKGLFISFSLWCILVDMKLGFTTGSVFVPFALFLIYRQTKNLTKNSKIA